MSYDAVFQFLDRNWVQSFAWQQMRNAVRTNGNGVTMQLRGANCNCKWLDEHLTSQPRKNIVEPNWLSRR